jgi:hypothetical protein
VQVEEVEQLVQEFQQQMLREFQEVQAEEVEHLHQMQINLEEQEIVHQ